MRKYRQRIHYTEADKNMMWDRWRKGESMESIAQLFDRTHGSVARHRRSAERSIVTAAASIIEPTWQIKRPGIELIVPRPVN